MKTSIIKQKDDFELKEEYDFSKGVRGRLYRPRKISTSMRLDNDILLYLKKIASEKKIGYQTLINNILREFIKKGKGSPGSVSICFQYYLPPFAFYGFFRCCALSIQAVGRLLSHRKKRFSVTSQA